MAPGARLRAYALRRARTLVDVVDAAQRAGCVLGRPGHEHSSACVVDLRRR